LTTVTEVRTSSASSRRAFRGLLWRDVNVLGKNFGDFLIRSVMQPLVLMFIFTYVIPKTRMGNMNGLGNGTDFASLMVGGILAMGVVLQGIHSVAMPLISELGVTREIEDRVLAPLPVTWVAFEKIVMGAFQGIVTAMLVFPVVWLVPATPLKFHANWLVLITVVPLACVTMAAGGLLLATLVQPKQLPVVMNIFLLPLVFLGAIFFPWQILSPIPWLQTVLLANPVVYVSEGFRAALMGNTVTHIPLAATYAALASFAVVFTTFGVRNFTQRVRVGDRVRTARLPAKAGTKFAVVVAVATASVTGYVVVSGAASNRAVCSQAASPEDSLGVQVQGTPRIRRGEFELVVTRDGRPVDDATVCLRTTMVGMESMAAAAEANRLSSGRYRVAPQFDMRGEWRGQVVLSEPGRRPAAIPLTLTVK